MSHTMRASAAGLRVGKAFLPAAASSRTARPAARAAGSVRPCVELLRAAGVLAPPTSAISSRNVTASAAETVTAAPTAEIKSMSGAEIRETFLKFYEDKGHTRLPSSSLVPEDPTVLLTIAGMLQFKPIFMGQQARAVPCATTTQKCIRTNDIENVGVTARHHTFFEMLGNFSFGDYFKTEAIKYAWELSTKVYGLPEHLVWVSVFEDDDEAYDIWAKEIGVPEERIMRMGAADNFWAAGATGPCGPCSELYFDFHPERGTEGADLEDDSRFIEFYNLVFMELNRDADGNTTPLANKNIDTGMGLERMAQILQGVPNNYETDLIAPICGKAADLAGITYAGADEATKTDLKVIGDHIRAVVYMISDGVVPSNVGRGYVVRRLLRRVVMKGRLLGIKGPFVADVAAVAVDMSGPCDPAVAKNAKRVFEEMGREESRFAATLDKGEELLRGMLGEAAESKVLPGSDAFMLYDTFGFPLEITQELAEAEGVTVDTDGFDAAMKEQRERSQAAHEGVDLTADAVLSAMAADGSLDGTDFVGYDATTTSGCGVVAMLADGEPVSTAGPGTKVELVLDRTPFYAESGGQVGDGGILQVVGADGAEPSVLLVSDVQKRGGGQLFVHTCEIESGSVTVGDSVEAVVDEDKRRRVMANHTATHLLQSALKIVLGPDTAQQGSLVNGERLRFDFNLPRGMEADEITKVEELVNSWVAEAHGLVVAEMPIAEAREAGATAMFGEKYGDVVRVVDVPGVSMELCGGTHVANTAQVGAFKILSESGIASGIRRVEALAGPSAVDYLNSVDSLARSVGSALNAKFEEIPGRIGSMQDEIKALNKQLAAAKAELALAKSAALVSEAVDAPATGAKVLVARLDGVDPASLSDAAVSMQETLGENAAVLLGSANGEKVGLVAAFGKDAIAAGPKGGAGKFVGGIAKMCGGGGGGRPNLAQAGAKDASKLDDALEAAKTQLLEAL